MGVHPQREKMEQVVEVDLPVRFGVCGEGQVLARLLACDARCQTRIVDPASLFVQVPLVFRECRTDLGRQRLAAPLTILFSLRTPSVGGRRLGRIDRHRVPRAVLVHAGHAVANPLSPTVHRNANEDLDLRHLERRRVSVPQEITNESPIIRHLLRPFAVTDAGGLHDGGVIAHHID